MLHLNEQQFHPYGSSLLSDYQFLIQGVLYLLTVLYTFINQYILQIVVQKGRHYMAYSLYCIQYSDYACQSMQCFCEYQARLQYN